MPSYFAPNAENTASLYYMNAFCGEAESRNIHAIRRNEIQNRPFYIRWGMDTCTYEKKHVSLQGKETEIILQTLFITWVRYKKTILSNQRLNWFSRQVGTSSEQFLEIFVEIKESSLFQCICILFRVHVKYIRNTCISKEKVVSLQNN